MDKQFGSAFQGARVLVTGHTGFKGAWLTEWLLLLGAKVAGYSLAPPEGSDLPLSHGLNLEQRCNHIEADVRDAARLREVVQDTAPDFVFHLAAQALVRTSYEQPVSTFDTNVMGTVHLLEALRCAKQPCTVVVVTSDKCYENREWVHGYRETDALGGHDPYSASKAAAELVTASWRDSFLRAAGIRVASARAGNVIGGGDWAENRIVPDCIRALRNGESIVVRNKRSFRPWQHVLEALSGYLWLAASMAQAGHDVRRNVLESAFNFGPEADSHKTVEELVNEVLKHWPGSWSEVASPGAQHEAAMLHLSIDKAHAILNWGGVWSFAEANRHTVEWYRRTSQHGEDAASVTRQQIEQFIESARRQSKVWASA
jgi:CDP-glucose 4,6-dehydratase